MQEKYNMEVNVQKPELHMLARCQSNNNQLIYPEERLEDLLEINTPITSNNGVLINDVIRIFKGGEPAAQLEARHQKVGIISAGYVSSKQLLQKTLFVV